MSKQYAILKSEADKIKKLEEELSSSHRDIVRLMPNNIKEMLEGYYSCKTRNESYAWKRDTVEELIKIARVSEIVQPAIACFSARVRCPLCKDEGSGPQKGFTDYEGVKRHLIGWGGHVQQCRVMAAALSLANDYFNKEFPYVWESEGKKT